MYNYGNHHRDFTYVDDVVGYISSIIKNHQSEKFHIKYLISEAMIQKV